AQHLVAEREAPDPHGVEMDAVLLQRLQRLLHRRRGRAEIERAVARRLLRIAPDRRRDQLLRGLELAEQPLHVVDVDRAFLAVAGVAVFRGAAREIGAAARMRAGLRAIGDAVAVAVEIAPEVLAR